METIGINSSRQQDLHGYCGQDHLIEWMQLPPVRLALTHTSPPPHTHARSHTHTYAHNTHTCTHTHKHIHTHTIFLCLCLSLFLSLSGLVTFTSNWRSHQLRHALHADPSSPDLRSCRLRHLFLGYYLACDIVGRFCFCF